MRQSKRVLVIGCPGAGKSWLSYRLSLLTGLPITHLDDLFFGSGWSEQSTDEWVNVQAELIEGEEWIIDGNYASTLKGRISRATHIVLVDRSRLLCLWRYVIRVLRYHFVSYEELPHYMRGKRGRRQVAKDFWSFIQFIWTFPEKVRPRILKILDERPEGCSMTILSSSGDIDNFLTWFRASMNEMKGET